MKTLLKTTILMVAVTFFASCQSGSDVKQILSNQDTRKAVIDSIANDSSMSKEMMGAMMNSNNGKMMMMENHAAMMKMMKDNPGMMKGMMADMMETCKGDSSMMSDMCKTMMGDPKMMEMMNKMKGMNKMKRMDKMDDKPHH